jgi:hypothetical protein
MSYTAGSFVADEQPTTAKWNLLWANDASFNDGTGIADDAIIARHISGFDRSNLTTDSNPYKFSAYMNAASQAVTASTVTPLAVDTENFDTNNNLDVTTNKGRYTVPVNGFYVFMGRSRINGTTDGGYMRCSLMVDGFVSLSHNLIRAAGTGSLGVGGTFLVQLTASQYVEFGVDISNNNSLTGGNTSDSWFAGFLLCRT